MKLSFQTNVYDISVDPKLMGNVYMNLLSNAIKYSSADKEVEVGIYIEGENVITKLKTTAMESPKPKSRGCLKSFSARQTFKKSNPRGPVWAYTW